MVKLIPGTPISVRTSASKFMHGVVVGEQFMEWNEQPRALILPTGEYESDTPFLAPADASKPMYVSRWAQTRGVTLEMAQGSCVTFPPASVPCVYYICFRAGDPTTPIYLPYKQMKHSYNKSKVVRDYADKLMQEQTGWEPAAEEPSSEGAAQ